MSTDADVYTQSHDTADIDTEAIESSLRALKERAGVTPEREAQIRQALADPASAAALFGDVELRQRILSRFAGGVRLNRRQRRAARKRGHL